MKNIAKADRPKSAMAILPLRPLRGSGNAAQTAFRPERSDAKTSIPSVNHVSADLGIRKMRPTFRIAGSQTELLTRPQRRSESSLPERPIIEAYDRSTTIRLSTCRRGQRLKIHRFPYGIYQGERRIRGPFPVFVRDRLQSRQARSP